MQSVLIHTRVYRVCIVNYPTDLFSDVGNILFSMDSIDFAVLWKYNHPKHEYYVSLMLSNKGYISAIVKSFDGWVIQMLLDLVPKLILLFYLTNNPTIFF